MQDASSVQANEDSVIQPIHLTTADKEYATSKGMVPGLRR